MKLMTDEYWMLRALELAKKGRGHCAPNPSVGAVVVQNHKVISEGYHEGPGKAHAEIVAFRTPPPPESTLYVTLEPCCHTGRTPPCTEAILKGSLKKVVYGHRDPNPLVLGKGESFLKNHGVFVEQLSLPEVAKFYESYDRWWFSKLPTVTAKIAVSLDGKIAGPEGKRQLSGEKVSFFTHQSRLESDAILTTSVTVRADNPRLDARNTKAVSKPVYVLDRKGTLLDQDFTLLKTASKLTLFVGEGVSLPLCKALEKRGVVVRRGSVSDGHFNLTDILRQVASDGIHDLWTEAGGRLIDGLLQTRMLRNLWVIYCPKWVGEGVDAFCEESSFQRSKLIEAKEMDSDLLAHYQWDVSI